MKKREITFFVITIFMCFATHAFCQKTNADHKVFLLGNLEKLDFESDYFKTLSSEINSVDGPYTVLVNGDFVGPTGLSIPSKSEETDRIDALISLGSANGKVILIIKI